MMLKEEDKLKELEYLENTKKVIKNLISEKEEKISDRKSSIIENKKHLWQNLNEYTDPEMYHTMNESDLNVNIINEEIVKVARLYRSLESPYFGRIDFNHESIYIGLTSVYDEMSEYVYDWRAPISNMYYNYGVGPASYFVDGKKIEGEITLKRQFKIEMGKLINAFDSDITVEDELLQDVLSSSSDEHMRNIVSTIQKEQNDVIRKGIGKNLIIEGIAGSGKTSVALHRIAYLLYNSVNLTNKNVLIFSPNEIFTSYISDVLPELGEENVASITKLELFKRYLGKNDIESIDEFIEKFYEDEKLDEGISYKFSPEYKNKIDEYVKDYTDSVKFTKKIGLKKKFITSDELNQMYKSLHKLSLNDRLNSIALKLCDLFDISSDNAERLLMHLKTALDIPNNPVDAYKDFLGIEEDADKIPYEDITPMMYLYFELNGYPSFAHIKHIVIDEAQDYTELDMTLFKKIFNTATFTILGDKNQSINPYYKYSTLKDMTKIFKDSEYIILDKAYRSSKEIIDYSNNILGITNVNAVRVGSTRDVIVKNNENDLIDDIRELKDKYKRIAVIARNKKECERISSILGNKESGIGVEGILKKIIIIPAYLSKGLEFDAVLVIGKNSYKPSEKNILYVALTRAEHALNVYE